MDLYIKETKKTGRGVFASRDFSMGEVIEACPVIVISEKDFDMLDNTLLGHYTFCWNNNCGAIVLGYGSIYNHSYAPNARFEPDFETRIMRFIAIKNIKKDEEITTNYNGNPNDKSKYKL